MESNVADLEDITQILQGQISSLEHNKLELETRVSSLPALE